MTTLETSPHEILTEVLSYLPCSDLAQTARVSHKLHTVSQPLLYTAPCVTSISGFRTPPSLELQLRTDPLSLQLFLRTLLSPGGEVLAGHVRSIRLKWDNTLLEPPTYLPPNLALIFAAAASRIGLRLDLASQGVQVVLLLHLLPNLCILDLGLPIDSDTVSDYIRQYHDIQPSVAADPQPLHQLREFRCSTGPLDGPIDGKLLLILLVMPNMRTVDVHIINFPFHHVEALLTLLVSPSFASQERSSLRWHVYVS